jgi:tetratricopeptide (TPR) repeat protein
MYELSIAAANEALELNPRSWMALGNIGHCYAKQGKFQDAINPQLQALELSPDSSGSYGYCWELGWDYLQIDKYAEALKYTDRAIQMRKDPDVDLYFNKALILLALGKTDEANAVCGQSTDRASAAGKHDAILAAAGEAKDFIFKRSIAVEPGSAFFELLNTKESQPTGGSYTAPSVTNDPSVTIKARTGKASKKSANIGKRIGPIPKPTAAVAESDPSAVG